MLRVIRILQNCNPEREISFMQQKLFQSSIIYHLNFNSFIFNSPICAQGNRGQWHNHIKRFSHLRKDPLLLLKLLSHLLAAQLDTALCTERAATKQFFKRNYFFQLSFILNIRSGQSSSQVELEENSFVLFPLLKINL